jgi:hypothetical protein
VPFDPVIYPSATAAFIASYGIPGTAAIYGPWEGRLDNNGEPLELQRPDNPNVTPTNTVIPYYLVERVAYSPLSPWPTNADGSGASLHRISSSLFGDDPVNWAGLPPFFGQPRVPVITSQPKGATILNGQSMLFEATVTGSEPLRYQWFFNRTNTISLATNFSLTISNAQVTDSGDYQLIASNDYGAATSSVARLVVTASPFFIKEPEDIVVAQGGAALFEVAASGTQPISYRWNFNTNTPMPGDGNSLLLLNLNPAQAGVYQCIASNAWGTAASRFARLTLATAPIISSQPGDVAAVQGSSPSLSVEVTGVVPLSYQWFFNGANPLPWATNSTITVTNLQPVNAGAYYVVISNSLGAVTSAIANLKILVPPEIDLNSLKITATSVSISVPSATGITYSLEYKTSLSDADWKEIPPPLPGIDGVIVLQDTNAPFTGNRFYRIRCR